MAKITTVYFVRHCLPDSAIADDRNRPLTAEGLSDAFKVRDVLKDKAVDVFVSSPYRRSIESIQRAADFFHLEIETDERLRERKAGESSGDDVLKKRWSDFSFAESGGECIGSVQQRNIAALKEILERHAGKTVVIGTHGTALSSILNYFDSSFGAEDFLKIVNFMPWIVEMEFDGENLVSKTDIFHIAKAL